MLIVEDKHCATCAHVIQSSNMIVLHVRATVIHFIPTNILKVGYNIGDHVAGRALIMP